MSDGSLLGHLIFPFIVVPFRNIRLFLWFETNDGRTVPAGVAEANGTVCAENTDHGQDYCVSRFKFASIRVF
jgi:hypothetical protein